MAITAAGKNRIMIFGPKRVSREWKPRLIECHEPRSDRQKQTRLRRARRERRSRPHHEGHCGTGGRPVGVGWSGLTPPPGWP
jgi:hypothetical protein